MENHYKAPRVGEVSPETKQDSFSNSVTSHPAFAQIGAYRVSGDTNLYDSDFKHNHYMTIKISRSELHRGLNSDRHHGREEYIEVALSESQWATFVSAPNMGSGVPCTLQHRNGQRIPGIPAFDRQSQVTGEVEQDFEEMIAGLDEALGAIDGLGLSVKKADAVRSKITKAKKVLQDHMPFAVKQFDEHVERSVERGKAEIHGYMTNVIQRAGIEALSGTAPLKITETEE